MDRNKLSGASEKNQKKIHRSLQTLFQRLNKLTSFFPLQTPASELLIVSPTKVPRKLLLIKLIQLLNFKCKFSYAFGFYFDIKNVC